jgi:hypothetical protein
MIIPIWTTSSWSSLLLCSIASTCFNVRYSSLPSTCSRCKQVRLLISHKQSRNSGFPHFPSWNGCCDRSFMPPLRLSSSKMGHHCWMQVPNSSSVAHRSTFAKVKASCTSSDRLATGTGLLESSKHVLTACRSDVVPRVDKSACKQNSCWITSASSSWLSRRAGSLYGV